MSINKSKKSTEKIKQSKNSIVNFTAIVDRTMQFLSIGTNEELGKLVGKSANTISTWKARNAGDLIAIIEICEGADLNWLILGIGEAQQTNEPTAEPMAKITEVYGAYDYRKEGKRVHELEEQVKELTIRLDQAERMFTQVSALKN